MKKDDLVQLRHSLVAYQEFLGQRGNAHAEGLTQEISFLEEFVNQMSPEVSVPGHEYHTTLVQSAMPSDITKERLIFELGVMLAKNVPTTFGYMLLVFGGNDQKIQFVTTIKPEASVSLIEDFVKQYKSRI